MKKLTLIFTILFCSISFGQIWKFDEWGGNLYTSTNAEIYGLNNVPLKHLLGGKYTFSRAGADLEALFDKIDSLTLAMSSLNILDDGLTTQILVGGGLNVVPVWGTNLPTAITIGSAYIYRVGGTDVADGDVADTITITNISQVQDITATATEINYTTDVTSNIQAQIDGKQDTVLGITNAEIAYLDGLTDTVQQQLDLKAPLTAPTFATSITGSYLTASEILGTDASKNIISLAVATYPNLTELGYVKGVTSAIQAQINLKAPLIDPTFTNIITVNDSAIFKSGGYFTDGTDTFYVKVASDKWTLYNDNDVALMDIDSTGNISAKSIGSFSVVNSNLIGYLIDNRTNVGLIGNGGFEVYLSSLDNISVNIDADNDAVDKKFLIMTNNTGMTGGTNLFFVNESGTVTVGSADSSGTGALYAGRGAFTDSVTVGGTKLTVPDYVFDKDYKQKSIKEMSIFYNKEKHLPTMPSENEIEKNPVNIMNFSLRLLETIEVQAKYIVELEKRITALENP